MIKQAILLGVILLSLIALPVQAILYQQDGFILKGSPSENWILITPQYNYFAYWEGNELRSIWIERTTGATECLIIRDGIPTDCTINEFSTLLYVYPFEEIQQLIK